MCMRICYLSYYYSEKVNHYDILKFGIVFKKESSSTGRNATHINEFLKETFP